MQSTANRAFLPSLTGLRGAAALWVVAYHVSSILGFYTLPALHFGYVGVDVFFVLSGFILGHVHLDDFVSKPFAASGRFLALRLSRIYPVHFVTLMVSPILAGILYALNVPFLPRFDPALLGPNLLLIQAWGWLDHSSFNSVSWSISGEWLAYLAFPTMAFIANRLSAKIALLTGFLVLAGEVVAFRALGRTDIGDVTTLVPLRMGGEFICGLCIYVVYRRGIPIRLPWGVISDLALLGFAIAIAQSASFAAVVVIPAGILGLAHGRGMGARFLADRRMVFIGEVSYSLYMVHLLVLECIFAPVHYTRLDALGLPLKAIVIVPALGLVAAATLLMHRRVEVPARQWIRRRLDAVSNRRVTQLIP